MHTEMGVLGAGSMEKQEAGSGDPLPHPPPDTAGYAHLTIPIVCASRFCLRAFLHSTISDCKEGLNLSL